jgi:hypothetical protein
MGDHPVLLLWTRRFCSRMALVNRYPVERDAANRKVLEALKRSLWTNNG